MATKRLNITISEEVAKKLRNIPNKSRFITEAVEEKLQRIEKEKLNRILAEGYRATKTEDWNINNDWEQVTIEGWIK